MCPTMTLSTSALCLHLVTTLARYTPDCQGHTAEMSVHSRRCHMALSSPWRWCLSVVAVLWRGTWWLLRTDRQCRQRHATEWHHTPRLQHTTTRSHCHLQCQSINITKLMSLLPHVANMSSVQHHITFSLLITFAAHCNAIAFKKQGATINIVSKLTKSKSKYNTEITKFFCFFLTVCSDT